MIERPANTPQPEFPFWTPRRRSVYTQPRSYDPASGFERRPERRSQLSGDGHTASQPLAGASVAVHAAVAVDVDPIGGFSPEMETESDGEESG
jgi:hypothetical protein